MSTSRSFLTHFSLYFISEIIVQASGFISLPIFARVFTTAEYGIMNLILTTLNIIVNLTSLGLRPSLFRFYAEYKKEDNSKEKLLFSTLFMATIASSLCSTVILSSISVVLAKYYKLSANIWNILGFSAVLIVIRSITLLIQFHQRVTDRPHFYSIVNISIKYLSLGIALFLILKLDMGLNGLYIAYILGEGVICLILIFIYRKNGNLFYKFSFPIFKESFIYGYPIMIQNFTGVLVSQGNRFIIAPLLGTANVGIFSMAQNISTYINTFLSEPLRMAFMPIFLNLWSEKGQKEAGDFLANFLRFIFFLSIPIMFGLTAVGENLIALVATEKYFGAVKIIPYVIVGVLLSGSSFAFYGGLFVTKKTNKILYISIFVSIVNMVTNCILIPFFGLMGAAWAILTCALSPLLGYIYGSKIIKIKFPIIPVLRYILCSFVMFYVVKFVGYLPYPKLITIILQISSGALIYLILILLVDSFIRKTITDIISKKTPFFKKTDAR